MKIAKIIKIVWRALGVVSLAASLALGYAVSGQQKRIRSYKETVARQEQLIERLASMEAVHCEVSITVKNTAVMGSNKSGDIQQDSKQIATYLRGEIIEKLINKKDTL